METPSNSIPVRRDPVNQRHRARSLEEFVTGDLIHRSPSVEVNIMLGTAQLRYSESYDFPVKH